MNLQIVNITPLFIKEGEEQKEVLQVDFSTIMTFQELISLKEKTNNNWIIKNE